MIYPETKTQIAILEWLAWQHPEVRKHVIKIDNEGKRSLTGNIVAVKAGLHLGASDLLIVWPLGRFHGLWMEVKRDGWRLTKKEQPHYEKQMEFIRLMRLKNYCADLVVGVDQGIACLKSYLSLDQYQYTLTKIDN